MYQAIPKVLFELVQTSSRPCSAGNRKEKQSWIFFPSFLLFILFCTALDGPRPQKNDVIKELTEGILFAFLMVLDILNSCFVQKLELKVLISSQLQPALLLC